MINILRAAIVLWNKKNIQKLRTDAYKVEKWVDVMKNKVLLIKYSDKKNIQSNELAIASIKGKIPKIEFSIKGFFNKDRETLKLLKTVSASHNLGEVYMAYIRDYKVIVNQYTGEVIMKEKLTLRERFKYKALWKKLTKEYINSKNKK